MPIFSRSVWESKAKAEFSQTLLKKKTIEVAQKQLDLNLKSIENLEKLIDLAKTTFNIEVKFCANVLAVTFPETKVIKINHKISFAKQVCILLHELGHAKIDSDLDHPRYGLGHSEDEKLKSTFSYRLSILDEEFEAWHLGKLIATELKLDIDFEKFEKFRIEMLKHYVKWTLGNKAYNKNDY